MANQHKNKNKKMASSAHKVEQADSLPDDDVNGNFTQNYPHHVKKFMNKYLAKDNLSYLIVSSIHSIIFWKILIITFCTFWSDPTKRN